MVDEDMPRLAAPPPAAAAAAVSLHLLPIIAPRGSAAAAAAAAVKLLLPLPPMLQLLLGRRHCWLVSCRRMQSTLELALALQPNRASDR